jgi:hypothetical protein
MPARGRGIPVGKLNARISTAEVDIETVAARFRDEVLESKGVIRGYLRMGAWARKV